MTVSRGTFTVSVFWGTFTVFWGQFYRVLRVHLRCFWHFFISILGHFKEFNCVLLGCRSNAIQPSPGLNDASCSVKSFLENMQGGQGFVQRGNNVKTSFGLHGTNRAVRRARSLRNATIARRTSGSRAVRFTAMASAWGYANGYNFVYTSTGQVHGVF